MAQHSRKNSRRTELIKAGVNEINEHGISGFSMRRVSAACGVSSAAPAKHFGDKKGFIAAIFQYVNDMWRERKDQILKECPDDLRGQLIGFSVEYIKFLAEHPHFRSILMLKYDELEEEYHLRRGELSELTRNVISEYCRSVGMDEESRDRKLYVIRSLIFGAALMFDNGEMEYNEHMLKIVRDSIEREFDLA